MRVPVNKPYTITTKFGVPDKYAKFGRHSGIDYAVPLNRDVLSPVGGTIEYAKKHTTGGNMLMVKDARGNYHRLMHNNSFVKKSGAVKEGQLVAKAGTTGLSTGVHVHHDIATTPFPISFSQFLDPNKYNDKVGVEMYKGKSAKHWYEQSVKYRNAWKNETSRRAKTWDAIKKLFGK